MPKGQSRSLKSKKYRQHNGQKKDLQNITQKSYNMNLAKTGSEFKCSLNGIYQLNKLYTYKIFNDDNWLKA